MRNPFRKRRILVPLLALIVLIIAGVFVVLSGALVRPSDRALESLREVPRYDLLTAQAAREESILEDYAQADYRMQEPYVIIDPYEMNPLSALVLFDPAGATSIEVTILGDDEASTLRYTKSISGNRAEVPILGLYADRENTVTLRADTGERCTLQIQTEPLPADFQRYLLTVSKPDKMEPGFTLMTACFRHTYSAIIDANAQVRGYLSNTDMAHGTSMIQLKNGNMLATGDEYKQIPYNMTSLWEFNWLGKIFREYEVPNAVHHDIVELANGNLLCVSNSANMIASGTREDVAIILDRETAEVVQTYDFREILDETRDPYHHFHANILHALVVDWMHMNAAIPYEAGNAIIVSSPTQSMVVCIDKDTQQIQWILGPHEGYEGSSAFLQNYLLTPVGEDFAWQWCQHQPMLLPDQDGDANTLDILLLDNGQSKSFSQENAVGATLNYSRAVQYRIDPNAMTVRQIWEYGKERGVSCYATFLGDANYEPVTGNRLITFGGQLSIDGVRTDDIVDGVLGTVATRSRVVEVSQSGEVVFEVEVQEDPYTNSGETYQAKRFSFYAPESFDQPLGALTAQRLGTSYVCDVPADMTAPKIFTRALGVSFDTICNENGRLVLSGVLTYRGETYLLSQAVVVLQSQTDCYLFSAQSALNGVFFGSIDTTQLKAGVYRLSIAGGVVEGNDCYGKVQKGHVQTEYKLTVPATGETEPH